MPILEIRVTPVGTPSSSISSYVTEACKLAKDRGFRYQVTAMSTMIEGQLDELWDLARDMHSMPFRTGANRVLTSITIDDRRDKETSMENQVEAVVDKI